MSTDDRRAAIEAAFEATEQQHDAESTKVIEPPEVSTEASSTVEETPKVEDTSSETQVAGSESAEKTPVEQTESTPQNVEPAEAAPQAWKAPLKSKWAAIDPEVRQEIARREREVTKVLTDTTAARQITGQLREISAPYSARFQAMGINPLQAFQNLLQADYQLATGSKHQRAQLVAKLIKDYDVDVGTLDEVLSGQVSPAAQEEARLAKLLEQHLAPVKQKLQTYEQREQAEQQQQEATFAQQIEAIANDSKTYPYFEQVREAMADLVEISARRGVSLDLKTAYNRAVAADPTLSAQIESAKQADLLKQAEKKAQRAKAASLSVNGAPSGTLPKGTTATDRRATIAAAFDALGS